MKHKFFYLWLILAASALISFSSCKEEKEPAPTPETVLELIQAGEEEFEMKIMTKYADETAYLCLKAGENAPAESEILDKGECLDVTTEGSTLKATVNGLIPETEYIVYAISRNTAENLSSKIATLEVKTLEKKDPEPDPEPEPEPEPVPDPTLTLTAGNAESTQMEITCTAENADCIYTLIRKKEEDAPEAEQLKAIGERIDVADAPVSKVFTGLEAQTSYSVYAVATDSKTEKDSEVASLSFTTAEPDNMIIDASATKTSVSYKINVPEGVTYRHTYIEGWYYDYIMDLSRETEGPEFDKNVVIWNMLADYGHEGSGFQEVTWTAGQDNPARHDIARLVGGKKYYVIASHYDPVEINWTGEAQTVELMLDPAGKSNSTIDITDEEITPYGARVRMNPAADVNFYYYDLYTKKDYDEKILSYGQEWMENYVYEYGYTSAVCYTDYWTLESDNSYILAIFGVDKAGDVFFISHQIDTPAEKQELNAYMETYDNPAQGQYTYDCLKITVDATTVKELNTYSFIQLHQPKSVLDETLSMLGMSMDMLRSQPEALSYLGATALSEEETAQLNADRKFVSIRSQLEPETEYVYLLAAVVDGVYVLAEAYAATDREPSGLDAEYEAFLGNWKVVGKTTEDYSTQMTYHIRIEQDQANYSYKIYGWGNSTTAQEIPFSARYDSKSKKMLINGNQNLGKITLAGTEYNLVFYGQILQNGTTSPIDFDGVIYEGKCNGSHMSMFPNFYGNYEICTMSYCAELDGVCAPIPGDEFNMISFTVDRE